MSPAAKKVVPIKVGDGQPLTRRDLQYDLLNNIFNDATAVFSDPRKPLQKVTFAELYIGSLFNSPKVTRILKDKLNSSPLFATHFAMLSLLSNVGRINTTMSFFPEMKTAVRTYHPIPALQRSNGNLHDAPRIKAILKSCLLESETKSPPNTPAEILSRANAKTRPPTSAPNLIFVLASHSAAVGQSHFTDDFEFIDLFLPVKVCSTSRARVFLWLLYHYLESSSLDLDEYDSPTSVTGNPFCDPNRPGKPPEFVRLTEQEAMAENVDPDEEIKLAEKLINQRNTILATQEARGAQRGVHSHKEEDDASGPEDKLEQTGKRPSRKPERRYKADRLRQEILKEQSRDSTQLSKEEAGNLDPSLTLFLAHSTTPRESRSSTPSDRRHSPYPRDTVNASGRVTRRRGSPGPSRSLVEHAWHVITTCDPLLDSDEDIGNESVRIDYKRRLRVVQRLCEDRQAT